MADWPYNTAAWQRLRSAKLARDPLCEDCLAIGMETAAKAVDHKRAISDGGEAFPQLDELSSKCWPCHSRKTARGAEHGAARTDKPMKGCDAAGNPIDPAHPWSA
jgi:5-methylcytosine-specific restriction protein A